MQELHIGQKAPLFSLHDVHGSLIKLKKFAKRWLIIYFYPKDDTPGCTLEASDFTRFQNDFKNLNCSIIGISPDSSQRHIHFIKKHDLGIKLLSDPEHVVAQKYAAWGLKNLWAKNTWVYVEAHLLLILTV